VRPRRDDDDIFDLSDGDTFLTGDCSAHDIHMAQMTAIDDAMQVIVDRLRRDNDAIWRNTLVVFSSDNGAEMYAGDNAPLRGGKHTVFEGGVRVPAFVSGGYLSEDRRGHALSEFAVHCTDWYATLLSAAGVSINYARSQRTMDVDVDEKWSYIEENAIVIPIDGVDVWQAIQFGVVSDALVTREVLLHLDEIECPYASCGALLYGAWKFMRGPHICSAYTCGWNMAFMTDVDTNVLRCALLDDDEDGIAYLVHRQKESGTRQKNDDDDDIDWSLYDCDDGCLFNLESDPCEMQNVMQDYPDIVALMEAKLNAYQAASVKPLMSENVTYLDPDAIRPTLVCDSEYWCPYMQYDDVEFEEVLSREYMRLYGGHDDDDNAEDVLSLLYLVALGVFVLIGMSAVLYVRVYSHTEQVRCYTEFYGETHQLL